MTITLKVCFFICSQSLLHKHALDEYKSILSEGEIQDGDNTEDDGYEEIVSEEEDMSDVDDRTLDIVSYFTLRNIIHYSYGHFCKVYFLLVF